MQLNNVSKSPVLHTLVLQGAAQCLLLLFSMLMARRVDIGVFGDFIFGFQFGQISASVIALGASFYLAKHFAGFSDPSEGMLDTFQLHNHYLVRGGLILLVAWCVFAYFVNAWVAIGSFGISIANFAIVMMMAFFIAIGKAPLGNLLQAGRSLVLCLGVLLSVLIGSSVSLITVVLVAAGIYALGTYLLIGRQYSFEISRSPSSDQFEFARQHVYFVVMAGIDVLILKYMARPDDVAIYGVALFLSNVASFALYAINANYTARISRSLRSCDASESQELLRDVARINISLSLPFLAILVAFSMNLTVFYGDEFEASEAIFLILLAGQVVNIFVGSVALVANVSGYESFISKFIFHSLLLKVVIGAGASFLFGALGMAIVASAANAIWNIRSFLLVLNKVGLNTTVLKLSRIG